MVAPAPTITLDSDQVSCAIEHDPTDGAPVLSPTRLTLLDAMTIDWGRDELLTQPDPSVLTFTMFDPVGTWLRKLQDRAAIGRPVKVTYWHDAQDFTERQERTIFRGYVSDVDIAQHTAATTRGRMAGWRVQIQASDKSGWLGNIMWTNGALPAQSMLDRAIAINDQIADLDIRETYFESGRADGPVTEYDTEDDSALDSVNKMYKSFGDSWTYDPDRNVINRIPSGSNFDGYTLRFTVAPPTGDPPDSAIRLGSVAWPDPSGDEHEIDREGRPWGYIGACDVVADVALKASALTDITTIYARWYNKHDDYAEIQTMRRVREVRPERALKFDSWFSDGLDIDPIIYKLEAFANQEASKPMHPELRWNTRRTGEIPTWHTFECLVMPYQSIRQVVLAGSPFTAALGMPPVWHPAGGLITYDGGAWDITVNLAPSPMPLPDDFTPRTWEGLGTLIGLSDGGTEAPYWADYDDNPPQYHLDRSVTYYDMSYVPEDGEIEQYE